MDVLCVPAALNTSIEHTIGYLYMSLTTVASDQETPADDLGAIANNYGILLIPTTRDRTEASI